MSAENPARKVSEAVLLGYLERQSPDENETDPVEWIQQAIRSHAPNVGGIGAVEKLVNEHPDAKHVDLFRQALAKIRASESKQP